MKKIRAWRSRFVSKNYWRGGWRSLLAEFFQWWGMLGHSYPDTEEEMYEHGPD